MLGDQRLQRVEYGELAEVEIELIYPEVSLNESIRVRGPKSHRGQWLSVGSARIAKDTTSEGNLVQI